MTTPKEFCTVFAIPAFDVNGDKSNEIVAGLVFCTLEILKKLNPLSDELNPVPVSSNFCRPSI